MKLFARLCFYAGFPIAAFFAGYRATQTHFEENFLPYRFETTGYFIGAAAALWTLGLVLFLGQFFLKQKRSMP